MIREAQKKDLKNILDLYKHLHGEEDYSDSMEYYDKWLEILDEKKMKCFIQFADNIAVASCIITVIPNLTRKQRPYSVIENVITHKNYRNRGYGKAIMEKAVEYAKACNCYKVMLMSDSSRTEAHSFYKKFGFDGDLKKGFYLSLP
ncbi:MAG: GNAT family N-acetyltransferase [Spirochaetaceae bacterium]|nr:GNAT family N-acetyltransferase [Spirochaetaceae bacterium]